MSEFTSNVVLTDEEGNEIEFEHIDTLEHMGEEYILLTPVEPFEEDAGNEDEESVVILHVVPSDEGDTYESIDDEALLEEIFNKFMEMLDAEEPYED